MRAPRTDGVYVAPDLYGAHVFRFLDDDRVLIVVLADETEAAEVAFPGWLTPAWGEEMKQPAVPLGRHDDRFIATNIVVGGHRTVYTFSWKGERLVAAYDSTFSGESGSWDCEFLAVPDEHADDW